MDACDDEEAKAWFNKKIKTLIRGYLADENLARRLNQVM